MNTVDVARTPVALVLYGGQQELVDHRWEVTFVVLRYYAPAALETCPAAELEEVLPSVVSGLGGSILKVISLDDGLRVVAEMPRVEGDYREFARDVAGRITTQLQLQQNPALWEQCQHHAQRVVLQRKLSLRRISLEDSLGSARVAQKKIASARLALETAEYTLRVFEEDQAAE